MEQVFAPRLPHPFYGDHVLYHAYNLRPGLPTVRAWEFGGWRRESKSWRQSCYISSLATRTWPHAGRSIASSTTAFSMAGSTRFFSIGFLRVISASASSPPFS
jgi:hypothetical protein